MLKLEKIARARFGAEVICQKRIPELCEIWQRQYRKMVEAYEYLPRVWLDETSMVARFIEQHVGGGIVVTLDGAAIGYMAYDTFDFHNEPTAFFPIMAHAADDTFRLVAYSEMYTALSRALAGQGCLNHLATFFAADLQLKEYLYEVGFGLYVVDAYRGLQPVCVDTTSQGIEIRKACSQDVDQLAILVKESDSYYAEAPLFLIREAEGKEIIQGIVASDEQAVFIAIRDKTIVGFMNVRRGESHDMITLSEPATALIDPLGAYIKRDCRGAGVGKRLLQQVVAWCSQRDIASIHVDFESANTHANHFWPRYFTPTLYSVKRRLNNDAAS